MRLGLVTDVHSHPTELARALSLLRQRGADRVVTIGDTIDAFAKSDGAAEVAALLLEADAVGVWGNHDFGLRGEVTERARARFPQSAFTFMARMQPRLVIANCHFSHKESSADPHDAEQLWDVSDRPLDLAERASLGFQAVAQQWQFVGHYHQWWATTPSGKVMWRGDGPLEFDASERYFVVVAATCEGWCGLLDLERGLLEPLWCGAGEPAAADGRSEGAARKQKASTSRSIGLRSTCSSSRAEGGIFVAGMNSLIASNTIWNNAGPGVAVTAGTSHYITRNSIAANTGIGIDLNNDGDTPNDLGDPDVGPNGLQNFPVIQNAVVGAGKTTVTGTLNSIANADFTLEFFGNTAGVPARQGQFYLGSVRVRTDGNGNANFNNFLPATFGGFVTATASDFSLNTSEFSAAFASVQAPGGGKIKGRTWKDSNGDGNRNVTELGMEAILVRLFDGNSTLIGSTPTDSNSQYEFNSVAPGTYYLNFQLPTGGDFQFSPQDQGSNDTIDSDVNLAGSTAYFTLLAGGLKDHLDAGLVPGI